MPSFAHFFGVFFITYSSGFLWKVLGNLLHVASSYPMVLFVVLSEGRGFWQFGKMEGSLTGLTLQLVCIGVVRLVWRLAIQLFSC